MRLIDADALSGYEFGLISPEAQKLFHRIINDAPTIERKENASNWISIDKRYPDKEGEDYLVCYDDGVITIETLFINYEELPFFSNMCVGVVAWMELPQPWKGE